MEKTRDYFKARLHSARKERGLSQVALAEKVGVEQPTIQRWESGKTEPSFDDIDSLAKALGVSAAYFFESSPIVRTKVTPQEALEVLARALAEPAPKLSPVAREIAAILAPLDEAEVAELLDLVRMTASRMHPSSSAHDPDEDSQEVG